MSTAHALHISCDISASKSADQQCPDLGRKGFPPKVLWRGLPTLRIRLRAHPCGDIGNGHSSHAINSTDRTKNRYMRRRCRPWPLINGRDNCPQSGQNSKPSRSDPNNESVDKCSSIDLGCSRRSTDPIDSCKSAYAGDRAL